MCVCDDKNVGELEVMSSGSVSLLGGGLDLDLAIKRSDRWNAQLVAWVTQGGLKELLVVWKKINYCPMCGRRLSLKDAGKENEDE